MNYVLITSARNEEGVIRETLESVARANAAARSDG